MRTSLLRFLCLLLLLASSLLGCKRADGDTVVEGTVIDRHTTVRIAHATVVVYRPGGGLGGSLGGGYVEYGRYQADASGNFSFRLDDDRDDLLLRAFSDLGAYTIWQEGIHLRGGRNNKDLHLKVQSPAWLKIHLLNVVPTDSVFVNLYGFAPIGAMFWAHQDMSVVYSVQGNDTAQVYWDLTPLGALPSHGRKNVYCPALDTIPLEIRY